MENIRKIADEILDIFKNIEAPFDIIEYFKDGLII